METHPLKSWLDRNGLSPAAFARRVGRGRQALHRYVSEGRTPDRATMRLIYIATGGQVRPDDFYPLAEWDREIAALAALQAGKVAAGDGEAAA